MSSIDKKHLRAKMQSCTLSSVNTEHALQVIDTRALSSVPKGIPETTLFLRGFLPSMKNTTLQPVSERNSSNRNFCSA